MGIKVKGFDKLRKRLQEMQNGVKELGDQKNVPLTDLFTPAFMSKYTSVSTLDEFCEKSGFNFSSKEDFENIPQEDLDEYVRSISNFSNWNDMLDNAVRIYISKKLGF